MSKRLYVVKDTEFVYKKGRKNSPHTYKTNPVRKIDTILIKNKENKKQYCVK
jgi:hypothetical protein